jgi:hypothetical protein
MGVVRDKRETRETEIQAGTKGERKFRLAVMHERRDND